MWSLYLTTYQTGQEIIQVVSMFLKHLISVVWLTIKKKKINDRYSSHYHKRYKNLFLRCVFQNLKGASFTVPNMPVSHSSKDIAFVSCGEIMNTFKMYNLNEGLKTKQ